MTTYVEIVPASQGLLPSPCPDCLWWQTIQSGQADIGRRLDWMGRLERTFGSVGMVAIEGRDTLAAVQFAPVRALPRAHILPPGAPPDESVLLFCLRAALGRPVAEARQLLHRSLANLRQRRVDEVYAFARPLGEADVLGVRNLFGVEFLIANGFHTVAHDEDDILLMRVELRGLVPSLKEAGRTLRRWTDDRVTPHPAT